MSAAPAARAWRSRTEGALFALALAALFLFTALFRFLVLPGGFTNDHFLYLAGAQHVLYGEWPTRDFLDPGLPLMFVVSALAQVMAGRTLFAEAVVVALAFAAAATLTAAAVREMTGSRVLGLLAALLEVAVVPRAYGYPKLLTYAALFFLLQRYVTRPTPGRLLACASAIVVAFLFRHDHGIYLGFGAVLTAGLAAPSGSGWEGARRAGTLAGACALLTAPYLVYVQFYGGLWSYLQKGLEFRAAELVRQQYVWPSLVGDEAFQAILLYSYWTLPVGAALVLVRVSRRAADARRIVARVAPIAVVALLMNSSFLRSSLNARLPDAIVPAVMLGAWLTHCAWQARHRWLWRSVSLALIALLASSVVAVGSTVEWLRRGNLLEPDIPLLLAVERNAALLRGPNLARLVPSSSAEGLLPFYDYVARCTTREHRLILVGFIPEVPFFTKRMFAGGRPAFVAGYYDSWAYQQSVLAHLRQQTVPFVLVAGSSAREFDRSFPLVARDVRLRYVPLATFGDDPAANVQVLVDRTLPVSASDADTSWPCFR